ncbi:MAG: hypothetical protein KUL75_04000 [Sterolibacterium sp.]|nr:hypothetical protein [Sterolibacterium sp.]
MYPLALVSLGAALLAFWLAWVQPEDLRRFDETHAAAHAANFWTYRQALVAYQNDNFSSANGYIPDTTLSTPMVQRPTGYFPPGYAVMRSQTPTNCPHASNRNDLWSNWFNGGRLYTFSCVAVALLPSGTVAAIANAHGRSLMIGIRQGDRIKTLYELDIPPYTSTGTFFPDFPPQIPEGAFVVIGN